jgi:uncharacterized protein YjlB
VRRRKPHTLKFNDDGVIPNHPSWPLIIYKSPVRLLETFHPAAIFEDLFASKRWARSWRNGIYNYVHYHSRVHEVMGVAAGEARVQFGGNCGRSILLRKGDVAVLPAGTGHKCLKASADFQVVGAYPPEGEYDLCKTSEEHDKALPAILKAPRPENDPVYGEDGPLTRLWS